MAVREVLRKLQVEGKLAPSSKISQLKYIQMSVDSTIANPE